MSFFTNGGFDINGFLLTPDTSTEEIKGLGNRVTVEPNLKDKDETHIVFNEQLFDNGMRFRVEVYKFNSISPDYIKIVPFKINDNETGEQLYERCRRWLETVFSKEVPDNSSEAKPKISPYKLAEKNDLMREYILYRLYCNDSHQSVATLSELQIFEDDGVILDGNLRWK